MRSVSRLSWHSPSTSRHSGVNRSAGSNVPAPSAGGQAAGIHRGRAAGRTSCFFRPAKARSAAGSPGCWRRGRRSSAIPGEARGQAARPDRLPFERSSHAATVIVQRESTMSSISSTGPSGMAFAETLPVSRPRFAPVAYCWPSTSVLRGSRTSPILGGRATRAGPPGALRTRARDRRVVATGCTLPTRDRAVRISSKSSRHTREQARVFTPRPPARRAAMVSPRW